ncbi:MAG: hypothetical protein HXY49_09770 [Ignavibacteriaceae bacterium]|jgi:hypothetical protein|nr:hypothetical protein [Ignavibacteriaceae bacterium]
MVLDLVITGTDDGFIADIPSLKLCECWAKNEEDALDKILELASFYLQIDSKKFKLDKSRREQNVTIYKLVFDKN